MIESVYVILALLVLVVGTLLALINRYRRCPSDKILVIYGGRKSKSSAKCVHGGGAFVWPIIEDYQYLSLTPISIDANLTNALSKQNIRVDVPCRFTVGVSTEPIAWLPLLSVCLVLMLVRFRNWLVISSLVSFVLLLLQ